MINLLSIIVPAYNEEKVIIQSLDKVLNYFQNKTFPIEVIVINDGSTDQTEKRLNEYARKNDSILVKNRWQNKGKGFSVKEGVSLAKGDCIVYTDADLPYQLRSMMEIVDQINEGFEIVIGTRNHEDSKILNRPPFWRRFLSRLSTEIIRKYYLPDISDSQCGLKGFSANVARELFPLIQTHGFIFDVELLILAKKQGYRIKEIPVTLLRTRKSTMRLFKDSLVMFREVFLINRLTKGNSR